MLSKEANVLDLFFNYPKHWHFEDLLNESKLSRGRLNFWLSSLRKDRLIRRIKPKNKNPYYVGNVSDSSWQVRKRMYALNSLYEKGLLSHLHSLGAQTVIIFGSFSRWDWYDDSDIDIFILGDPSRFEKGRFEKAFGREIHLFVAEDDNDLSRFPEGLLKNIADGFVVKGSAQVLCQKRYHSRKRLKNARQKVSLD